MKAGFEGKSALITGAGSGIGRAAALTFARNGITVVAVDINPGGLEETVAQVQAAGGTAHAITCDMTSGTDADAMFSAAVEACGSID
ncbi:MAG: SDR family NAD(P)-dependent oxidoreductase, partial [Burkholderiales bacterium]